MRLRFLLSSALVLGLLFSAGCKTPTTTSKTQGTDKTAAKEEVGEILAVVNGMEIGSVEFEKSAARTVPASGDTLSPAEKKDILDRLIADKVLYIEALKQGLDKDPKVQKVMVNTLLREEVYSKVRNSDFTDEMLQAYYTSHPDEFVVPEKVQIKRILIRITDEKPEDKARTEAETARREVMADPKEKFKDVAAKVSEDPYRRRGGDIGFVSKEGKPGLDQSIVDRAFEMPTNQVSDVFKTAEGFNIVYVANRRERVERTFLQMKGSVLRKVKNEKLKEMYDNYVNQLRQGANVSIREEKLAAVEIKHVARPTPMPGMTMNPPDEEMGEGNEEPMIPGGEMGGEGEE